MEQAESKRYMPCIISHKIEVSITTAVRTSNPTQDLKTNPYKIQIFQTLSEHDKDRRTDFCLPFSDFIGEIPGNLNNIFIKMGFLKTEKKSKPKRKCPTSST
jgi:hypothetical protein